MWADVKGLHWHMCRVYPDYSSIFKLFPWFFFFKAVILYKSTYIVLIVLFLLQLDNFNSSSITHWHYGWNLHVHGACYGWHAIP